MSRPAKLDPAELQRLVDVVASRHARLRAFPTTGGSFDENVRLRTAFRQACGEVLAGLARDEGARCRENRDCTRLSLGGVTGRSTGGVPGVLANWLSAARQRLTAMEADDD